MGNVAGVDQGDVDQAPIAFARATQLSADLGAGRREKGRTIGRAVLLATVVGGAYLVLSQLAALPHEGGGRSL